MQLSTVKALTVRTASDVFLDSLGNPNTVRNYGIGVGRTAERLGEGRPLASVADDETGEALELLGGVHRLSGTPPGEQPARVAVRRGVHVVPVVDPAEKEIGDRAALCKVLAGSVLPSDLTTWTEALAFLP